MSDKKIGKRVKAKLGAKSEKLTIEQRRAIYCVKHGHSRLRESCFGYTSCARCGQTLGDSLGGAFQAPTDTVYVSHMRGRPVKGCPCRKAAKKLTAKDFALVPKWNTWGEEMRPPWRVRGPFLAPSPPEKQPSASDKSNG